MLLKLLAAFAVLSVFSTDWCCAQFTSNDVRLELRIVAQRGAPGDPGGVVDLPGDQDPITAPGQVRRFEVQYRLIDLNPFDPYRPAGLAASELLITATPDPSLGHLERALLSRYEATQAGPEPPSSVDLTVPAPGGQRGLHRPYRGGVTVSTGNDSIANGVFSSNGLSISRLLPLCLSQTDQNAPGGEDGNGAWYGLYSFDFVAGVGEGHVVFTVAAVPDPQYGTYFAYYKDGEPAPVTSIRATGGSIGMSIIPVPTTCTLAFVASILLRCRARRSCSCQSGSKTYDSASRGGEKERCS